MRNADGPESALSGVTSKEPKEGAIGCYVRPQPRERAIIFLLCILGALRVFVFSAAFPFFNNVDEPAQFDLVVKYANGHVPRRLETFSAESSVYLALFGSCVYMGTPEMFPDHKLPVPPWTEPVEKMRQDLAMNSASIRAQTNYEVSQPPLYYGLAGLWWRMGEWCGLNEERLLYWLRFLNIALIIILILLSHAAARFVFPENSFLQWGTPAVVAFMPQTVFYSIANDTLSAVCFGVVFLCLLKWWQSGNLSAATGAAMGLAFAATYLVKMTNLPLLAVAGAAIITNCLRSLRTGKMRSLLAPLALFLCGAVPAMIFWTVWCKSNFDDFTGAKLKMDRLGWTLKPFAQWWHHPIFTPAGAWTYFAGQMGTFWQGEFRWHNEPMSLPGTDAIYSAVTLVLLAAVLPALFPKFSRASAPQRQVLIWSLACLGATFGFFAFLSIIYDFHDCPNPSRDFPYFHAGRMMLGVLIPFLLLIVYGLDRWLNRFGDAAKYGALTILLSAMLILEIVTDWPVFFNPFNWFHLP